MTGEELKELRNELGLTQPELAAELGKDPSTIQRWESSNEELPRMVELAVDGLYRRNSTKDVESLLSLALDKLKKQKK